MELIEQIRQLRQMGANSVEAVDGKISKVVFERQMTQTDKEIEKLVKLKDDELLFASSGE
jgi:hypothetical protein